MKLLRVGVSILVVVTWTNVSRENLYLTKICFVVKQCVNRVFLDGLYKSVSNANVSCINNIGQFAFCWWICLIGLPALLNSAFNSANGCFNPNIEWNQTRSLIEFNAGLIKLAELAGNQAPFSIVFLNGFICFIPQLKFRQLIAEI